MAKKAFDRFITREIKGAKKKEMIRQEKKKVRAETKAFFDQKKQQYREEKYGQDSAEPQRSAPGKKSYSKPAKPGDKKAYSRSSDSIGEGRNSGRPDKKPYQSKSGTGAYKGKQAGDKPGAKKSWSKSSDAPGKKASAGEDRKPYDRSNYGPKKRERTTSQSGEKKPYSKNSPASDERSTGRPDRKPYEPRTIHISKKTERPADKPAVLKTEDTKPVKKVPAKSKQIKDQKPEPKKPFAAATDLMPLNKYIAHSGICSRRDGAELVRTGKVTVNDRHITDPGFKVMEKDDIRVNGKKITAKRPQVYILLNKPKDYLTTTDDPQGRKTVLDIIKNATAERVYPIGRLDRNTTGVLLLTNDGELAQKLSHPKYMIKKIYEVKLDKPLIKKDFDTVLSGVTLEDGFIAPDSLAYADTNDKSVIGIEIHSGKNRIVRRIFESLGYDVRNLDRVMYANLTKKNVERGKWRMLSDKEIRLLKFMNSSYSKKQ